MPDEKKSRKTIEDELDEALEETFPASDPVAVGRNDHPGKPASARPGEAQALRRKEFTPDQKSKSSSPRLDKPE